MECFLHGVAGERQVDELRSTLEGLAGFPPQPVDSFTVVMHPDGGASTLRTDVLLVREKGAWSIVHKTTPMLGTRANAFCASVREDRVVRVASGDPREMFGLIGFVPRAYTVAKGHRFSIPRGNHAVVVTVQQLFKADAEGAPAAQPVSPGHWLVEVSVTLGMRPEELEGIMQALDALKRQLEHLVVLQKVQGAPRANQLAKQQQQLLQQQQQQQQGKPGEGPPGGAGQAPAPEEPQAPPGFTIVFA